MKKGLFGYNKKEVDTALETLKNENEELNLKLTNIMIELAEAKKEAAKAAELESVKLELAKATEENTALCEEMEKVRAEAKLSTANAYSAAGEICSKAYADMDAVRKEVASELTEQIENYEAFVALSSENMKNEVVGIRALYTEILDKLLNTTNEFVNKVKIIDEGAAELETKLDGANDIPVKLKKEIGATLKTPMADPVFDASEILSNSAKGTKEVKEDSKKVIDIHKISAVK